MRKFKVTFTSDILGISTANEAKFAYGIGWNSCPSVSRQAAWIKSGTPWMAFQHATTRLTSSPDCEMFNCLKIFIHLYNSHLVEWKKKCDWVLQSPIPPNFIAASLTWFVISFLLRYNKQVLFPLTQLYTDRNNTDNGIEVRLTCVMVHTVTPHTS